MIHIYGIPNCNSVKKALDWLKANDVPFTFHDFKKEGVTSAQLKSWIKLLGKEVLINKKGTTWRGLSNELQETISTQAGAIVLMMEKTSVIKRPIVAWENGTFTAGFDEALFSSNK